MSIPQLRTRYVETKGFEFRLLEPLTGEPLHDGQWFTEEEVKEVLAVHDQSTVSSRIAQAKAGFLDRSRSLKC